jgi:hypothetical protein
MEQLLVLLEMNKPPQIGVEEADLKNYQYQQQKITAVCFIVFLLHLRIK